MNSGTSSQEAQVMPGHQVILCKKRVLAGPVTSIAHRILKSCILKIFFVVLGFNVRNHTVNEENGKARGVVIIIIIIIIVVCETGKHWLKGEICHILNSCFSYKC